MSGKSDAKQDKALQDTFPASDPPANSGITGPEGGSDRSAPKPSHTRPIEERPTGTPTSDRHATETAHQWEHHVRPNEDSPRQDTPR